MKTLFEPKLGRGHSNISKKCPGCTSGDTKSHGARLIRRSTEDALLKKESTK